MIQGSNTAAFLVKRSALDISLLLPQACTPHLATASKPMLLRLIWLSHKVTFPKKVANFTQFLGSGSCRPMATYFAPRQQALLHMSISSHLYLSVSSPRRPRCWNIWQRRENMSEKCFKKLWRRTITSAKWQRKSWYWKWNRSKKTVKLI